MAPESLLSIPVSSIAEYFRCAICMGRIRAATIIHCGHRYCETCISQWHNCPKCNRATTSDQLIRDHVFDSLTCDISRSPEKKHCDQMVSETTSTDFEKKEIGLTLLEAVLQKHLKHSMAQHEAYHQKLVVDYQIGLAKLAREKYVEAQRTISEFPHDLNHPGRATQEMSGMCLCSRVGVLVRMAKMAAVEEQWEVKKKKLQDELERVERMFADAYDRYLTENLSPPSTIPISVKLTFPEKGFEATDIVLKPDETMASIVKRLQSLMVEKGMEIIHFPSLDEMDVSFVSPFTPDTDPAASGEEEGPPEKMAQEISFMNQVVQPDCRPVLQYSIKLGTEIRFKGKLVLKCDLPVQFTSEMTQVEQQPQNRAEGHSVREMKLDHQKALFDAAKRGSLNKLRNLHMHGAKLAAVDDKGWTPLHYAAQHGREATVEYITRNVPPDVLDMQEPDRLQTPLHKAAWYEYQSVCKILVEGGASLLIKDYKGDVPSQKPADDTDLVDYLKEQEEKQRRKQR
ncbi:hypothetical protein EMCRGX_G028415 [Ephydatia muelleri]